MPASNKFHGLAGLRRGALVALMPLLLLFAACESGSAPTAEVQPPVAAGTATAVFAGGCFWCMEPPFDALPGVISTISGYSGGNVIDPSYEQVSSGTTGHIEVVQVRYDPTKVSYQDLLGVFWRNIDPVAVNRQFCDRGPQYRSAIFYTGDEERRLAEASRRELQQSGRFEQPIATELIAASTFYPAEDYHQDYYLNNPLRYKGYRWNCGRDQRLEQVWGDSPH